MSDLGRCRHEMVHDQITDRLVGVHALNIEKNIRCEHHQPRSPGTDIAVTYQSICSGSSGSVSRKISLPKLELSPTIVRKAVAICVALAVGRLVSAEAPHSNLVAIGLFVRADGEHPSKACYMLEKV